MDKSERFLRVAGFTKSILAGKITLAQVEKNLKGWVSAGMISADESADILERVAKAVLFVTTGKLAP